MASKDALEAADDIRTFMMSEDAFAFPGNRERIAEIIEAYAARTIVAEPLALAWATQLAREYGLGGFERPIAQHYFEGYAAARVAEAKPEHIAEALIRFSNQQLEDDKLRDAEIDEARAQERERCVAIVAACLYSDRYDGTREAVLSALAEQEKP